MTELGFFFEIKNFEKKEKWDQAFMAKKRDPQNPFFFNLLRLHLQVLHQTFILLTTNKKNILEN